ncbi:YgaP family membrane protein [Phaeovulum vinaykumarii]|uniref:Inner membrane protein YgaP-like transmembrane domain-containing protein n=1 Tax=Phaeovulum vinaykumarii TaxID=407234 RepID=A0A1N7KXR0_9RHOB|nr:DUF2892 domain-containing protein [Phaeovulum vinaykumarii]SIS66375.1 Protein of unknown function [Phaeovulum vinaykumarii]SOC01098.1 hypothetical protein SAMN05878426_102483 [Phaeovulum vinaykumarii]
MDFKDFKIEKNVGGLDKTLRIVIGLALLFGAIIDNDAKYVWLYFLGIIPLATGLVGYCGLYKFLGINTCPKQ